MKKILKTMTIFLLASTSFSSFACDVAQSDLERGEAAEAVVVVPDTTTTPAATTVAPD